ncbi:MAG: c-type cytochrome [Planctomycetes bacterium]|nr:c-type cytochrome [Planctomycetota bacterium]
MTGRQSLPPVRFQGELGTEETTLIDETMEESRTKSRKLIALLAALATSAMGCAGSNPKTFRLSKKTAALVEPAREVVAQVLEANFGRPDALIAWLELPVRYGQIEGEVLDSASIPAEERGSRFRVRLAGQPRSSGETNNASDSSGGPFAGLGVLWLTGEHAGKTEFSPTQVPKGAHVAGFDPVSGVLRLSDSVNPPPQPGDRFVLVGERLQRGNVLFRENCAECHGITGDGNGPKASGMNPKPRDYRKGVFKFTSTKPGLKPARADLVRTIQLGIPGTYMPSFEGDLSDEDIDALVEYVRWLSMRGELELRWATLLEADYSEQAVKEQSELVPVETVLEDLQEYLKDVFFPSDVPAETAAVADAWRQADDPASIVVPKRPPNQTHDELVAWFLDHRDRWEELLAWYRKHRAALADGQDVSAPFPDRVTRLMRIGADLERIVAAAGRSEQELRRELQRASLQHGRRLFLGDVLKCASCHGEEGRGDGPQTKELQMIPGKNEFYPEPGLYDDWGHKIHPNDLTRGIYRGGKRPIDVYRRIYSGIKGTPMASFATTLTDDDDIWDLVRYVLSLSSSRSSPSASNSARRGHASEDRTGRDD